MISIVRLSRIFINKVDTTNEAMKPIDLSVVTISMNSFIDLKECVVTINAIISSYVKSLGNVV